MPGAASARVSAWAQPARSLRVRARPRTRWWFEALTIAWLFWLYDVSTNLAPLRLHAALANARGVLHLERALGIDPELTLNRWLASHHSLATIVSDYYDNAHFIVTLGLLAWLWWARADIYRPLRNALVIVNVLAFVVFWRWPVAPPRMLTSLGFSDVVSSSHAFANFHAGALASHANELAAMPSLHMAWAAWCGVVLWRVSRRRWVRAIGVLYPSSVVATVIATGNHFVLDLVAGAAALAFAILLAGAPARVLGLLHARSARARSATPSRRPLELAREPGA